MDLSYQKLCCKYLDQLSPALEVEGKIAIEKLHKYHNLSYKEIYSLLKSRSIKKWEEVGHFHLLFKSDFRNHYFKYDLIDWTSWFLEQASIDKYADVIKTKYYNKYNNKQKFTQSMRQLVDKGKSWKWILTGLTDRTIDDWNKYGLGLLFVNNYSKRIDKICQIDKINT